MGQKHCGQLKPHAPIAQEEKGPAKETQWSFGKAMVAPEAGLGKKKKQKKKERVSACFPVFMRIFFCCTGAISVPTNDPSFTGSCTADREDGSEEPGQSQTCPPDQESLSDSVTFKDTLDNHEDDTSTDRPQPNDLVENTPAGEAAQQRPETAPSDPSDCTTLQQLLINHRPVVLSHRQDFWVQCAPELSCILEEDDKDLEEYNSEERVTWRFIESPTDDQEWWDMTFEEVLHYEANFGEMEQTDL